MKRHSKSIPDVKEAMAVKCAIESISPADAKDYLASQIRNRPLKDYVVDRYARDMESGNWRLTGESIIFSDGGNLLNGQHRLTAVVQSDRPITSVIVRGVSQEAFDAMDQGTKRTNADVLNMRGEVDYAQLAGALSALYGYRRTGDFKRGGTTAPTIIETERLLRSEPGLRRSLEPGKHCSSVGLTPALGCVIHFVLAGIDRDQANDFFDLLRSGAGLGEGHPILRLRDQLIANRAANRKMDRNHMAALTFRAWNYWRDGRTVKILRWRQEGPSVEAFPVPT